MMDVINAAVGLLKEPAPESTTGSMVGVAPIPAKPQPKRYPPPNHPLFMQPPAVRAAAYSSIAKKKMIEAKMHADIARTEADKAEDEWRKSVGFAAEAASRRDACVRYQLHSSLVHSLNRLVGFGARTEAMLQDGKAPLGAAPPELSTAGNLAFEAHKQLEISKADVKHLEQVIARLKEEKASIRLYR